MHKLIKIKEIIKGLLAELKTEIIWTGCIIFAFICLYYISHEVSDLILYTQEHIQNILIEEEEERISEILECVDNGYIAYIDGTEVDINKLDLSMYRVSIDHETKEIFITNK